MEKLEQTFILAGHLPVHNFAFLSIENNYFKAKYHILSGLQNSLVSNACQRQRSPTYNLRSCQEVV